VENVIEVQEIKNDQIVLARDTTPNGLLALAIQKDLDIEKLTKLMELQERWQANEAKKAWVSAMSKFKENPPQVYKDMLVSYQSGSNTIEYTHASLGNAVSEITKALSNFGLFANWKQSQTPEGKVTVTCIVTHKDGHSEETSLTSGADTSGGKNAIQAIGSANTYLQRYTLFSITGLAPLEKDDDGKGAYIIYLSDDEIKSVQEWIDESGANKVEFLKYMKVESLEKMPYTDYAKAIRLLKERKENKGKK